MWAGKRPAVLEARIAVRSAARDRLRGALERADPPAVGQAGRAEHADGAERPDDAGRP
ncbi:MULTISPECIES: hypothetical protein [unclassified Streptomyces]|uniref:hypothetical protein n=1 Tax=unclassified Streptomyces TaxID=2593676 RepID=UPI00226F7A50|nr:MULTISPECIES: hypothetical protein [unclassified Streptomyces]MCY0920380.1 hypothetical protein [Streptomyces sp. H27-G5]MCY0961718.1 hypothetical protein [Streptomyces sp. H27-H5]